MQRKYPSDIDFRPSSERAKLKHLASRMFPQGVPPSKQGRHEKELSDFLKLFTGTPHEKAVWDKYYEWRGYPDHELPELTKIAEKEGLTVEELLAKLLLESLQRFTAVNNLVPRPATEATPQHTKEPKRSQAGGRPRGGRKKAYSDQDLKDIKQAWDKFLGDYKKDKAAPKHIRRKSTDHFIDWAERSGIDIPATDKSEARQMLEAYRKRFSRPIKRKKKSSR